MSTSVCRVTCLKCEHVSAESLRLIWNSTITTSYRRILNWKNLFNRSKSSSASSSKLRIRNWWPNEKVSFHFIWVLKGGSEVPQIVTCPYILRNPLTLPTHLGILFPPPLALFSNSHTFWYLAYMWLTETTEQKPKAPVYIFQNCYSFFSCRHVNTANMNNCYSSNSLWSRQLSSSGKRA